MAMAGEMRSLLPASVSLRPPILSSRGFHSVSPGLSAHFSVSLPSGPCHLCTIPHLGASTLGPRPSPDLAGRLTDEEDWPGQVFLLWRDIQVAWRSLVTGGFVTAWSRAEARESTSRRPWEGQHPLCPCLSSPSWSLGRLQAMMQERPQPQGPDSFRVRARESLNQTPSC